MGVPTGFDRVLETPRPSFGADDVLGVSAEAFGLRAKAVQDLGSERDQAFLLLGENETPVGVLKLSNAVEDPAVLDMEALAVFHAKRVDPGLPLAVPRARLDAIDLEDPASRRGPVDAADGRHYARLYDVLPGRRRVDARALSDRALADWGETAARLDLALRGFFHPRAQRTMLWDVQHASRTRALAEAIRDDRQRRLVERALDHFDEVVPPVWPSLRAQVVHTDLTTDNALTNDDGLITGIVDFGDMSHSALVTELSSVLDSVTAGRGRADPLRVARLVLDGFERRIPLEPIERTILGELWAARAAITIAISSWRSSRGLEDPGFAERYNASVADTLETLLELGWAEVARRLGGDPPPTHATALARRRESVLGPALEQLTYDEPIQMASAAGVWMTDADGRRYLDAYNNVPCVGHGHPRVTEAIARQSRRLNTNLRYLHTAAIELAERLVATCPPGLDTVLFVNSGSEANDLAWRLATTYTGNAGGLCTSHAYHGISATIAPLSPETWPAGRPPNHVETWPAPDPYRGIDLHPSVFEAVVQRLAARGIAPAATILDGVLTSDGYPAVDPAYIRALVGATHAAGGLWIADEVQGGHGRTGVAMWSFERFGIEPDVVTLGKPMGNGHPVGAVITRREIAQRFAYETTFFSTFGGNQVSVAASLAVLDVLDDERVLPRVASAGEALRDAIWEAASGHEIVGDVRGVGLAIGVEIVRDPVSREPAPALAAAIQEGMRREGVLIGTTGAAGNVLKVRPPLAFTVDDVPVFTRAFLNALRTTGTAS
jgi:4-aminobutyrate aminotransferase-like enzyme